MNPTKGFSLSL